MKCSNHVLNRCIFCPYCTNQTSFVVLKRKTNEDDYYVCDECRDISEEWIEWNSFHYNEVEDYCNC